MYVICIAVAKKEQNINKNMPNNKKGEHEGKKNKEKNCINMHTFLTDDGACKSERGRDNKEHRET